MDGYIIAKNCATLPPEYSTFTTNTVAVFTPKHRFKQGALDDVTLQFRNLPPRGTPHAPLYGILLNMQWLQKKNTFSKH